MRHCQPKRQPMPDALAMPGHGVFIPFIDAPTLELPLDSTKVSAGFPSPAADYEDRRLDINDYLIRNPVSTFFFPVEGDSMEGAEIFDGDILVVEQERCRPTRSCRRRFRQWRTIGQAPV